MGAVSSAESGQVGSPPSRPPSEPEPPGSTQLPVTFYLDEGGDLAALRRLDPDRDLDSFRVGERSWVVQTYLRLRQAGHPVELSAEAPGRGLVVFHAKQKRALARSARTARAGRGGRDLVFVGIRADNSSPLLADFEVLQNGRFAEPRRRFVVPFWPQPGLLPRDCGRGSRLERVGYVGLLENLHPDFRGEAWPRALAQSGMEWVPRAVRFRQVSDPSLVDWEDYRSLDALLAVRPRERDLTFSKPASKLINAWRAGVPALMGPEYAFREIRSCPYDYFEVTGAEQAFSALRQLQGDPGLYRRMVCHGRERAQEFSFEAITARWAELLFSTLPARIAEGILPWSHRLPIPVRLPLRRLLRWITLTRAK